MSRSPETADRPGSRAGHRVRQGGRAFVEANDRRLLGPKREGDGVNDFILDRAKKLLTGDRRPSPSSLAGKPAEVGEGFRPTNWGPPPGLNIKKEPAQEHGVSPKSSPKLSSPHLLSAANIEELIAELDVMATDIYAGWPTSRNN